MVRSAISRLVLLAACICSAATSAATFPPLIDTRTSDIETIELENRTLEIIAPDDAYVDLSELDDIDNDGVRDHQFQIFLPEDFDAYANLGDDPDRQCPSLYIAASSVVGNSVAPADAVELKGLDVFLGDSLYDYGCYIYSGIRPTIVPDINGDGINELFFYGDSAFNIDPDNPADDVIVFGSVEQGGVVDIAGALNGDGGFAISSGLYVQNDFGDINGDAIPDPIIYDYTDGDLLYASLPSVYFVDGASLPSIARLSSDTINDENVLLRFDTAAGLLFTGPADFNGDNIGDVIVTEYGQEGGVSTYVLYGSTDIQAGLQRTDFNACDSFCDVKLAGDFNADGFDDAMLFGFNDAGSERAVGRIVYGGSAGLPSSVNAENSTKIAYAKPDAFGSHYLNSIGDINGDGASDLYFENFNSLDFVLLGQNEPQPADILIEQLNGENGFLLIPPDIDYYSSTSFEDINNDGADDLVGEYGYRVLLLGRPKVDLPVGVQALSVATGQTMTFLSWQAPDALANIDRMEIFVNDVLVDAVDANSEYYQFSQPAPDSQATLRVHYVDNANNTSPALIVPLSNPYQALKQLRATVYGENTVELIWDNEPSDYIVWRNGDMLAQVSGNSYIDSDVRAGVDYRYHVTQGPNADGLALGRSTTLPEIPFFNTCIDYCGDYSEYGDYFEYDPYYFGDCSFYEQADHRPAAYRSRYPASTDELLVVTDTAGQEFSTPFVEVLNTCAASVEFRPLSGGYQVYSATALELFWQRANHVSGVVAYEVSLFGEVLSTIDATSFFVDNVGDEVLYEYKVTAIAGDGSRSTPVVYSIYLPENDQNLIDLSQEPPAGTTLRGEVYSSTAAELFWDTVYDNSGSPVTYNIYRDGKHLLTSDARSYFDDSLMPNATYYYEVETVSQAGVPGITAEIQLSTPSDGGVAITNDTAQNVLPSGARGQVYSNNALELFWDRPDDNSISHYLIDRNGDKHGETDGITFYDSGLIAETEYRYSIQAMDSAGNEVGEAAYVVLKTKR